MAHTYPEGTTFTQFTVSVILISYQFLFFYILQTSKMWEGDQNLVLLFPLLSPPPPILIATLENGTVDIIITIYLLILFFFFLPQISANMITENCGRQSLWEGKQTRLDLLTQLLNPHHQINPRLLLTIKHVSLFLVDLFYCRQSEKNYSHLISLSLYFFQSASLSLSHVLFLSHFLCLSHVLCLSHILFLSRVWINCWL